MLPDAAAPTHETALELHLRRIIETQPGCLARLEPDGRFLAVNDATLQLLGVQHLTEVLGTSLLDRLAPLDQPAARAFLERVAAGEQASIELPLGLDGNARSIELHGVPLTAPIDGLDSLLCTFRDVTEHRRLEEALVEGAAREGELVDALAAERELRAAVEANPVVDTAREHELEQLLTDARAALEVAHAEHELRLNVAIAERETAAARALEDARAAHVRETEALRERLAALERSAAEAAERERELAERCQASDDRSREAEEQAERARSQLQVSMAALEAAARDAATRDQELTAACEAEQARCRDALDRAAAAERALSDLQVSMAALEATAREADAREREWVARYEADQVRWQEELGAVLQAFDDARVEQRAIESRWQHALRLADAARLASAVAGDLEAALHTTAAALRRLLAILAGGPERVFAQRALGSVLEAALLARRLGHPDTAPVATSATTVIRGLEPTLGALLGPEVQLAVLAGDTPLTTPVTPGDLETMVLLLVSSQRGPLHGGSAALEIAETRIDADLAGERGVRSGAYVVVALHGTGPAAARGIPDMLFATMTTDDAWAAAGPALAAVHRLAIHAGGHVWACREREDAVSLELYLPRIVAAGAAGGRPAATESAA